MLDKNDLSFISLFKYHRKYYFVARISARLFMIHPTEKYTHHIPR